jgi:hypothetical protein
MRPLRTPASLVLQALDDSGLRASDAEEQFRELLRRDLHGVPSMDLAAAMVASREMFSGTRPDNLGVKDGRFAACKPTPNCVSSQADPADREHYIMPIAFNDTMHELRRAVESMTRADRDPRGRQLPLRRVQGAR